MKWLSTVAGLALLSFFGCQDGSGEVFEVHPPGPEPIAVGGVTLPSLQPGQHQAVDLPKSGHVKPEGKVLHIPKGGQFLVSLTPLRRDLTRDFTLELWLWLEHDADQTIIATGNNGLRVVLDNCALVAEVGGQRLTGPLTTKQEWFHLALVVDGSEAKLYVNGAVQDREFLPETWDRPRGSLVMGHIPNNSRPFAGDVDNLRLVAEAIYTQANVSVGTKMVPVDDTLFGFNFEHEIPGGGIPDIAGKGIHAKILGNATIAPGHV